jgi:hypothetical protein
MAKTLLNTLFIAIVIAGCTSTAHNSMQPAPVSAIDEKLPQPEIASGQQPLSLMTLPQTQYGGFVLKPGFYEGEFKTYCLQPGTPDPRSGDAYLQGDITGNRKDIVETVLLNSRERPEIAQRNVQLLLWSVVSGSDFNKLSSPVQADARKLLSPKQIFKLQGGVVGAIKTISYTTGILNTNNDMKRLFETGLSSYESFEKIAVLKEQSQVRIKNIQPDQWYRQPEKYFIRYFPVSYQKVRIQVYMPDGVTDSTGKAEGEYIVFDPTGKQAIPAFTNAQRLGVGAPVLDVLREIIRINKKQPVPGKLPRKQNDPAPSPKQAMM